MKNHILLYTILLLFSVNVFGQLNIKEATYGNEQKFTLGGITVKGAYRYDPQTIVMFTGLKKGAKVEIPGEEISNAIKKLWKQHLFSDINFEVEKIDGDVIYLTLNLVEVPNLSKVNITGLSRSKTEDIVKEAKLTRGKMVTEDLIINTQNYITGKFVDKGYLETKVTIKTKKDTAEANAVFMNIFVDTGDKVKIDDIIFIGNDNIPDSKLRGAMKETKRKSLWNIFKTSKYIEDDYEADLDLVVEYYKERGYRDARVTGDSIAIVPDNNRIALYINVDEGNVYRFGEIKFVGNSKFTTQQLESILTIKEGDVYNGSLLDQKIGADQNNADVRSAYMDSGYLFAQVNPVEVGVNNDSIDLEIRIHEGKPAHINKIFVKGNTRTNDHVIYREIRTKPGQLFSKSELMRTYRELAQLQFFDPEAIGVDPIPHPETNTVDIKYTLQEKSTSQIELQGGWGGGQFIGTVGLSFNNFSLRNLFNAEAWHPLPTGDGQRLSLRAQASFNYQSYSFSFTEPWWGGRRPISLSTSFYHSRQFNYNYLTYDVDKSQILAITGASIGITKRLSWPDDYFTLSQVLSLQRYDLTNYQWYLFDFQNGNSNNVSYEVTLGRNSSGPNPIYPIRGSNFSASLKLTPPFSAISGRDFTGEPDKVKFKWLEYYKVKFSGDWYTDLWNEKLVLRTYAAFGFIGAYNETIGAPPFERFYVGGDGMANFTMDGREVIALRGYANNSLSPNNGGVLYNKFTMELRFPITLNPSSSIYALGFAEAGGSWDGFSNVSPFELRRSAGVGLRIFMPMFGMLGVDFGYGFDPSGFQLDLGVPEASGWQTHFIIGQQF
ncbi:MAG: outer membrane protein assembly factor BamA [Bacteroidota bacterium]